MCLCAFTLKFACLCLHLHIHMHVRVCLCAHVCAYACACVCVLFVCPCIHVGVCVCLSACLKRKQDVMCLERHSQFYQTIISFPVWLQQSSLAAGEPSVLSCRTERCVQQGGWHARCVYLCVLCASANVNVCVYAALCGPM